MSSKFQHTGSDAAADSAAAGPALAAASAEAEGRGEGAATPVADAAAPDADANIVQKPRNVPPALAEKPAGLPPGNYKLVALELEATGRKLFDEVIQIAAHTPHGNNFSQYIMPHRDLKQGALRRLNVHVETMGRYRKLMDTTKQQVIQTKCEISALEVFLNWLESIKDKKEMIILMYHEPRRLIPTLLIQSLVRHRLFDRFKKLVAGFTDSYALFALLYLDTYRTASLMNLTGMLLDWDLYCCDTALDRAVAIYNIIEHVANQDNYLDVGNGDEAAGLTGPSEKMMMLARQFARPIQTDVEAFGAVKDLLEQTPLVRTTRTDRLRLLQLRRLLIDAGLLYEQVKKAWLERSRSGLRILLIPLEQTLSAEDIQQLVDLFDKHFSADTVTESSFSFTDDSDGPYLSSDADSSDLAAAFYGLEEELDF